MTDHSDPQAPAIAQLRSEVEDEIKRGKVDAPGWTLSIPSLTDLEASFVFVRADSKDDEDAPYVLPSEATEASVAVIRGSVQIIGHVGALGPGRFYRLGSGDGREIQALEPHTTIVCQFFRKGVADGAAIVDSGEAASAD